jgi:hypothetical protein
VLSSTAGVSASAAASAAAKSASATTRGSPTAKPRSRSQSAITGPVLSVRSPAAIRVEDTSTIAVPVSASATRPGGGAVSAPGRVQ